MGRDGDSVWRLRNSLSGELFIRPEPVAKLLAALDRTDQWRRNCYGGVVRWMPAGVGNTGRTAALFGDAGAASREGLGEYPVAALEGA